MNRISVLLMKIMRRIKNQFSKWYNTTSFLSGLESYGEGTHVREGVALWNDHVTIGSFVNIYQNVTLWGPGRIKIGNNTEIGINCTIYSSNYVEIGNNTLLAANCYIIDSNHGIKKDNIIRNQVSEIKGPVVLEDDVWLGNGVTVLSGVHISKGAVIGAGAVVNTNIPEYAIAVGIPAKVVGYRR